MLREELDDDWRPLSAPPPGSASDRHRRAWRRAIGLLVAAIVLLPTSCCCVAMHVSDGISGGDVQLTNSGPSSLCDITREHGLIPSSIARLDPGASGSMWLTDANDHGDAIRFRRCGSGTRFIVRVYGYRAYPSRLDLDERDGSPCARHDGSAVCVPAETLVKADAR